MLQCRGGCGAGTSCARGLQPRLLTSAWLPPAPRTPWGRQHKHRRATCVTYASARGRVERATRRDLPEVADSFVLSFFLDGKEDLLDGSSRRRLVSAALKDLEGRYGAGCVVVWRGEPHRRLRCLSTLCFSPPCSRRGRAGEQRALLVVRDADGSVVACAGVEPQPFQQNVILVSLSLTERTTRPRVSLTASLCVWHARVFPTGHREEHCGRRHPLTLCAARWCQTSLWPPPRGAGAWRRS